LLAYGQSDEYSFVFRKDTGLYSRRCIAITHGLYLATFTYLYLITSKIPIGGKKKKKYF
jgi:tRNA(His) 5'-end guanylyltransferase